MRKKLNLLTKFAIYFSLLTASFSGHAMLEERQEATASRSSGDHAVVQDLEAQKSAFFERLQAFSPENRGELRDVLGFIENRFPFAAHLTHDERQKHIIQLRRYVRTFDFQNLQSSASRAGLSLESKGKSAEQIYQMGLNATQKFLALLSSEAQQSVLNAREALDPALMAQFAIVEKKCGGFGSVQHYQAHAGWSAAWQIWEGYTYWETKHPVPNVQRVPFWEAPPSIFRIQFVDLLSLLPETMTQHITQKFQEKVDQNRRIRRFHDFIFELPLDTPSVEHRVLHTALSSIDPQESFEDMLFLPLVRHNVVDKGLHLAHMLMCRANPLKNPSSMTVLERYDELQKTFKGLIVFDASATQRRLMREMAQLVKPYVSQSQGQTLMDAVQDALKKEETYAPALGKVMLAYAELAEDVRSKIRQDMEAKRARVAAEKVAREKAGQPPASSTMR